mmetsp:Transcript_14908/g.30896  ORF Transcript_14908/g.30896 Transcript_14908/m.30896 type:complete len:223 (+) Transcript_14908:90-758(+)
MSTTRGYRVGISSAFSIVTLALSFSTCASFAIDRNGLSFGKNMQVKAGRDISENPVDIESRRDFVSMAPTALISCITGLRVLTSESAPALAADKEEPLPTREAVTVAFDFIRFELNNSEGGVAYMQGRIDQEDLEGLLEFSRTYDLEFRKRRFGGAKKLFQDKEIKAKGTEYANAVTFDLIGINRSCRKGQENVASASKYLQELRDDVNKFLALEKTIEVQQ